MAAFETIRSNDDQFAALASTFPHRPVINRHTAAQHCKPPKFLPR